VSALPDLPTTRAQFKQVAAAREAEAAVLMTARQWSGAYYLVGYAVECGLKAILVKQFRGNVLPDKNKVNAAYTHDLSALLKAAGLEQDSTFLGDAQLRANWNSAKGWNERSRYKKCTRAQATEIVSAVTHPQYGIMNWLRTIW
jgi:HEPN domain-containing protein